MRDRFPEPVATFKNALELLQSEKAYLPEMSGEIVCYLKSGKLIKIPNTFFLFEEKNFASIEEATQLVNERAKDLKPFLGAAIANPELSLEEQVKEAMQSTETLVIPESENLRVCNEVNEWLNKNIDAMSEESANKVKPQKNKHLSEVLVNYKSTFPNDPLSAEELEKKPKDDADTLLFFKTRFEELKSPKRWVINSRDYGLTAITGDAYFDVVNNHWTSRISGATCIKDKNIAEMIITSFGEDGYASLIEHFVSQKELAKTAIKMESEPAVIHYHTETDTYLYEERNLFSDYETLALISISNPDQFTIQKNHPSSCQLHVSIPDIAMDELAKAWCKHRNIQGVG
tara:strand:- start:352 stop:1386 length:1035 start_codon:yes stop_codon:yes gene_type:complete